MPIALLHVCIEKKKKPQLTLLEYKRVKMKYYEIDVMHEVTFSDFDAYSYIKY